MANLTRRHKVAGRPKLELDENLILSLARIHCTHKEMASILGCSTDTLKDNYSHLIEKGRDEGKMSLRRSQFKKAIDDGNVAMQIWLGKQYLDQKDKIENNQIVQQARPATPEEIRTIMASDYFMNSSDKYEVQ